MRDDDNNVDNFIKTFEDLVGEISSRPDVLDYYSHEEILDIVTDGLCPCNLEDYQNYDDISREEEL